MGEPTGQTQTHYVEDSCLVADLKAQVAENMEIDAEELDLQFGIQTLQAEEFLGDCVTEEATICVHMSLDGGKKKKKRKPKTTPKVIKHKHKKRAKALLDYFSVDDASGKVKRLKQESPAGAGVYMADHPDSPVVRPEPCSTNSPLTVRDSHLQSREHQRKSRLSKPLPPRRRQRSEHFLFLSNDKMSL